MAPKAKRAQQQQPPAAAPQAVIKGRDSETNRSIFEEFNNDLTTITQHESFKNIVDDRPLEISTAKDGGGNQVPYTQELYETAMKSTAATYKRGGNIFWLDQSFNPNPGTPLSVQRIKDLSASPVHFHLISSLLSHVTSSTQWSIVELFSQCLQLKC